MASELQKRVAKRFAFLTGGFGEVDDLRVAEAVIAEIFDWLAEPHYESGILNMVLEDAGACGAWPEIVAEIRKEAL